MNDSMIHFKFQNSYLHLPPIFYKRVSPQVFDRPSIVLFNEALAAELGLQVNLPLSDHDAKVLAGSHLPEGADPIAMAYAGHQFGGFTMLGDGRAHLIGEHLTPQNVRFDIQLKGSGQTPYSRRGDGRATLGPMLREYIVSQAMHAFGIPTTRSLAVIATGETVWRERALPGAMLVRVASSHLRVGTFEFASAFCQKNDLKALIDYTIKKHHPDLDLDHDGCLEFLKRTIQKQAELIARWMNIGFIHGVMNTDNMSISGETIDYGPCAFMDEFDPTTVFSSIDQEGRYAFQNQPGIGLWNLHRFAETLLPFLSDSIEESKKLATAALEQYKVQFSDYWMTGLGKKIGLTKFEKTDETLAYSLLELMTTHKADFTATFIALTEGQMPLGALSEDTAFKNWFSQWIQRLESQPEGIVAAKELMREHNPRIIPRNHLVEEALSAAVDQSNMQPLQSLLKALSQPFADREEFRNYEKPPIQTLKGYQTFCGT